MSKALEEVVRRIEVAKRAQGVAVDLSALGLTAIPDALADLANLKWLDLSSNEIATIPDFLADLTNLQRLNLWSNLIRSIPDSLARLTNLQALILGKNRINVIPDSLAQLSNLESLNLSENRITAIPDSLAHLVNLQYLNLSYNHITAIPDSLAHLTNLQTLKLFNNRITAIPESLAQLNKLQSLNLSDNEITAFPSSLSQLVILRELGLYHVGLTAIPECLTQLANLRELYLGDNQLTAIPESLTGLAKLQQLMLGGNPLPEELRAALSRGIPSLFRYLQSTAKNKVYPRTVKVVLLGEPQSGKTTLLEALKGNPQPCDDSRKETLGVNVATVRKETNTSDGQPMFLSVWDFAGQHIEHATHQFFLTENAIFLILWNARQGTESGKRDLWYWLELVTMRVRDPKFILVATHTEHTPPDFNLAEIESSYKGGSGVFPVELSNLNGFRPLESKILELAASSPSLRAEWPAEWLVVRDEVRKIRQNQPYITPAAFRDLMTKKGVSGRDYQRDLAGQLHRLGEILYFQERAELSGLVILNPEWVTELIALVVRSKEVRERRGILRKTDLDKLWKHAKLGATVRDHLIHLMDWFDLMYSTGHATELGIVVEVLPYSTSADRTKIDLPAGQPKMEMIFRFPSLQRHLPPGIPTWGIARAHRFSTCTPWRDAAAFEDRDSDTKSQAIISASHSAKEVRLCVAADYPPFFFGRIEAILQDTFKRYRGAEPERRLPCSCRPDCPTSYLFETVLKRRKEGKGYVTCDQSGEDVPIESLLGGVRRTDTPEGVLALRSEMRRVATEHLRALNEQMEKTCPSVFTLVPKRSFELLDTWIESLTKEDELELALYCEHDSGWHPTSHSLYCFTPDHAWFGALKEGWNKFLAVTKYVAPLAKTVGKAAGVAWPGIEVGAGIAEKLPEARTATASDFIERLGRKARPGFIDIETRYLLKELIDHLDARRAATEPKNGGLHRCLIDDSRLLWLCPEHLKLYKTRP